MKALISQKEIIQKLLFQKKTKQPIYRGCPNRECFCTGKCKEIIGYRDI